MAEARINELRASAVVIFERLKLCLAFVFRVVQDGLFRFYANNFRRVVFILVNVCIAGIGSRN